MDAPTHPGRSLMVAPAVKRQGMLNQQASHINKGYAVFSPRAPESAVRPSAYAPARLSQARPQQFAQLLAAVLHATQFR